MNHAFIFLSLSLWCFPLIWCIFCSSLYWVKYLSYRDHQDSWNSLSFFLYHLQFPDKPFCRQSYTISLFIPYSSQFILLCIMFLPIMLSISSTQHIWKHFFSHPPWPHPCFLLQFLGDGSDLLHSVLVSSEVALKGLVLPHESSDLHQRSWLVVLLGQQVLLTWNTPMFDQGYKQSNGKQSNDRLYTTTPCTVI